jgi:hypothetical protein
MAPQDRVLYGKMMGMSQKTARGKIPVSVMHLAQRFYKTVNDMPAARGRDVLDSSKELSIPLSNHVESQDLREIAAIFDTDLDVVEKGCKRVAMYIESPQQACKPQHFAMKIRHKPLFKRRTRTVHSTDDRCS